MTSLCRELGRLGTDVHLLSVDGGPAAGNGNVLPPPELVRTILAPAYRLPLLSVQASPAFRPSLVALCKQHQFDVLHDHGVWLPSNHATASVARTNRIPLVVSVRGMLEPWSLGYRAWKKRAAWHLYQRADLCGAKLLHATSNQEAENLRRLGLRQPLVILPNGIDPPAFHLRGKRGSPERTAVFLSRLHPKKGLLDLVEAWAIVRPAGWRVVVAGPDEGGHRSEVEARVRAVALQDDFEFIGPVDDSEKWALLGRSDLFLLPSHSENFGVAVAEALACGVPVITTRACPWGGLEQHGAGWWIDVGVPGLVEALRDAVNLSEVRWSSMSAAASSFGGTFAWPRIAEQMLSAYSWLAGRGSRPSCVTVDR